MTLHYNRRNFIKKSALAAAALGLAPVISKSAMENNEPLFKISLAQWSLNPLLFGKKMDNLDFAPMARKHGIEAVEYVNQFFMDKAEDKSYLKEMKNRAEGEGVSSVLIMCDREGQLGHEEENERIQTVENHKKWVEAAKYLGCHSIRVNGYSTIRYSDKKKVFKESQKLVADGWRRLCEFAKDYGINIIIENHGGFTSHGEWLAGTIELTDHPLAGSLPDFGNFRIQGDPMTTYDAYKGVQELMPYAKGVSVKIKVWDDEGQQQDLDYKRMMQIVLDAGYHGYCGIEHAERGREWEAIVEVRDKLIAVEKELRS